MDNVGREVLALSLDDFGKDIHKIMQAEFRLSSAAFTLILHSFRHGEVKKDCMLDDFCF